MSQTQDMENSSTESYNYHDETTSDTNNIILDIFSHIIDNSPNNQTTDLQTKNSTNISGEFHGFRHQALGIIVGIMLFVVVLIFATLHFVFRKRKNRNNFK